MASRISRIVPARRHSSGGIFALNTIDLDRLEGLAAPLALLDDFLVSGAPFGPHPHAGFSAITYVLEDSPVGLRSRDSLGNDLIVRPGGIVWLQAGRGAQHQEIPAIPGLPLHGAQIYVNLSARNKLVAPRTFYLQPEDVPVWTNNSGDRVRILVGSFDNVASPLRPEEPYRILDIHLASGIDIPLGKDDNTVVYVLGGEALLHIDGETTPLTATTAIALSGTAHLRITGTGAQVLALSGPALNEPVYADGPFIMNDEAGIRSAIQRFRSGQMGQLAPV